MGFTTNYEGEGAPRKCDECSEYIGSDDADTCFFTKHEVGTLFTPSMRASVRVYELHFCATCIAMPEVHADRGPLYTDPTMTTLALEPATKMEAA